MPVKYVEVPDIGSVTLTKRKGSKAIRITIAGDNTVRISMPPWVPYQAGIAFVKAKQDWINQHRRAKTIFNDGDLIGKAHRIRYIKVTSAKLATRVTPTEIKISVPTSLSVASHEVQTATTKAAWRALKQESLNLLPQRLKQLAAANDFTYKSVNVKRLKSRWGSCGPHKDITLNIFLMQLPWQLIDYVLLHELVHTKVLNHSSEFWEVFNECLPQAKTFRKQIHAHQPSF